MGATRAHDRLEECQMHTVVTHRAQDRRLPASYVFLYRQQPADHLAAVHHKGLTRDVRGCVRAEEQHHAGHLFRLRTAMHWCCSLLDGYNYFSNRPEVAVGWFDDHVH